MHVVRFAEAPGYDAPGHHDMKMVRLQGREAGPAETMWIGVSVIAPDGGTVLSASPQEKMYVVLEGEVHVSNGSEEVVLGRWDSCRIEPGEDRRLTNRSKTPASLLLVMPLSAEERPAQGR
ncbi:cupin domain-containing protein [Bradyrhizobium tropiciagri]|uniref:cupin domain-containing protein n=1 Tax=Bradyrhizobium tropiciagri TaxID=312253 RepID=UPI001BA57526|nr:cupin domain-containing protein [Bradyrhizobium tropiciagri]MBR0869441.1 cupin domain-containing protein [Bradyrhizobium tropiciagri]